jgi:hypothetical protein
MTKFQTEETIVKESTESTKEKVTEEVDIKPVNPKEVTFEEDLSNMKKDTLDKIKNTYDESELDEF